MKTIKNYIILFLLISVAVVAVMLNNDLEAPRAEAHRADLVVNQHYRLFGDYSFEVITEPDEDGYFNVKLNNVKNIPFDYLETVNNLEAKKKYAQMDGISINRVEVTNISKESSYVINMHIESGITINDSLSVFNSAINFFEIL